MISYSLSQYPDFEFFWSHDSSFRIRYDGSTSIKIIVYKNDYKYYDLNRMESEEGRLFDII